VRPSTFGRLAISGTRTDTLRLVLTAFGAALATLGWLCAATVAALGLSGANAGSVSYNTEYTSDLLQQPGLRPGVITTFILLTIPVLALVAQCSRLGAPARDRRIAAIRLAGATPAQAVAIGAGEAGASALLGSTVGTATYLVLRRVLDHVNSSGQRTLPTDVRPAAVVIVTITLALPVLATLLSASLLRAVTMTPLGVVHRVRRRRSPRPWPGVLIVVGVGLFAVLDPMLRLLARHGVVVSAGATVAILYVGVLTAVIGVAVGAGWISYAAGLGLRRYGRRAATQLAGARMIADPWQGSRTFGVLIVAAVFGGGTAAAHQYFASLEAAQGEVNRLTVLAANEPGFPTFGDSYLSITALVAIAVGLAALTALTAALGQLISLSEAIVSRRRTYAALVATGVPRRVLARSQLWQAISVAVPAFLVAGACGAVIVRFALGTTVRAPGIDVAGHAGHAAVHVGDVVTRVPVPWTQLGVVVGGSVGAVLLTVAIGLLFLKSSTSIDELRTT
jgi:FtsX-like permease family